MRWVPNLPLALGLLLSTQVDAFTLFGNKAELKGWDTKELTFHLNPEYCPDTIDSLLAEAMQVWNEVPTANLKVVRGEDVDTSVEEALQGQAGAGTPTIHCVNNISGLGTNADVIPGYATAVGVDAQRHINYGVLVLNVQPGARANIEALDQGLVIGVIAHEIGHVLGLGHSSDQSALMYYDGTKREQASLAQDDADGFTYLYPRDELKADAPLGGCGVIPGRGGPGSSWPLYILFALPVLLVRARNWRF